MNNNNKTARIEYLIVLGLILYMPFHYYICELFLKGSSLDNLVRDIFILVIFILTITQYGLSLKMNSVLVVFNAFVLVLFALVSAIYNDYPKAFNILRTYLLPSLMYFICSRISINKVQLQTIHKVIVVELALIATYGFIQAFFLGDDFAIMLGYPSQDGYLSASAYYIGGFFGFQRSVGTFVSPNICGVILGVSLCLWLTNCVQITKLRRYILIGLTGIGLLATFSRSAIVGVICAAMFLYIVKFKKIKFSSTGLFCVIVAIASIALIVIFIDNYYLDNLFTDMLFSSFNKTFTLTDTSAAKHLEDLYVPLQAIVSHPFGFGFGNNGPMALETIGIRAHTVESSIYLMMYEVGLVFGVLYFAPFVYVIIKTCKNKKYKYYAPAAICVMELITFVFLPNVQTYEVLFYIFLFIGLYDNKSVRTMYLT